MVAARTNFRRWTVGTVLAIQAIACNTGASVPAGGRVDGGDGSAGTAGGVDGGAGSAGSTGGTGTIDAGVSSGGIGGVYGSAGGTGSTGFAGAVGGMSGAAGTGGGGASGSGSAGSAGVAGTGVGSGGGGGGGPLSHAKDIQPIWDMSCVIHCHSRDPETVPAADLELWPDGYPATINVPSKQSALVLIKPGSPSESYLWRKLDNTFGVAGGTGKTMPLDSMLSPGELAKIRQWILEGAAP